MNKKGKTNIIISGGNFNNKGAQAMLFITASELRKYAPGVKIFFDSQDKYRDCSEYGFEQIDREALRNALLYTSKETGLFDFMFKSLRHAVRMCLEKNMYAAFAEYKYIRMIRDTEALLDISGYALSSEFSEWHNKLYLDIIRGSVNSAIDTYILPQSFGPFDYDDKAGMIGLIKDSLAGVRRIYAREDEGLAFLQEAGVSSAHRSSDIVLQSRIDEWSDHLKGEGDESRYRDRVWIVPNMKLLKYRTKEELYALYDVIVDDLLKRGEKILLVYNSNEDQILCRQILENHQTGGDIELCERELNFYEYMRYVRDAKFIISSRYHSLVMALKEGIPCIALGWAVKYEDLFRLVGQEQYVIGITDDDVEAGMLGMIDLMEKNYRTASEEIIRNVADICRNNCFDDLFEAMRERS
ncbi:MAG: polysaccharide pyruvyl transferase family protein [Lachnospiraceae bacterium]|nr:polysaccharide pyruvyl transferase family protein [Lachnospiraceae bacterium]